VVLRDRLSVPARLPARSGGGCPALGAADGPWPSLPSARRMGLPWPVVLRDRLSVPPRLPARSGASWPALPAPDGPSPSLPSAPTGAALARSSASSPACAGPCSCETGRARLRDWLSAPARLPARSGGGWPALGAPDGPWPSLPSARRMGLAWPVVLRDRLSVPARLRARSGAGWPALRAPDGQSPSLPSARRMGLP